MNAIPSGIRGREIVFDTEAAPFVCEFVARGIAEAAGEEAWSVQEFGPCRGLGVLQKGRLIGGTVFFNWNERNAILEMAGFASDPRWLSKHTLHRMFEHPFETLGCRLVYARHAETNRPARRLWQRMGATEVSIPWLRGEDEAECVAVLRREDWTRSKYGPAAVGMSESAQQVEKRPQSAASTECTSIPSSLAGRETAATVGENHHG